LTITNSDEENSVIAKLVIREELTSRELIDVMIYLSPGDRWRGNLSCTEYKSDLGCVRGKLTSDDDSLIGATTVKISPIDPEFQQKTIYHYVPADQRAWGGANGDGAYKFGDGEQTWNQGYAEVFLSRTSLQAPTNEDGLPMPVDKDAIYEEDWNAFKTGASVPTDGTPNVLSGTVTLNLGGSTGRIQMEAINDYDNTQLLVVGKDTLLGENAETSIGELEAVLAKNELVMPYGVGEETYMITTFPTKQSFLGCTGDASPYFCDAAVGVGTAPFFLAVVRDMEENIKFVNILQESCEFNNQSPPVLECPEPTPSQEVNLTHELNILPVKEGIANALNPEAPDEPAFFSEEGWVKITIEPAGDLYNGGVPVIATYVTWDGKNTDWVKAASTATVSEKEPK
jgi:hypothetical protein